MTDDTNEPTISFSAKELLERMDSKLDKLADGQNDLTTRVAVLERDKEEKKKRRVEGRDLMIAVVSCVAAVGAAMGAVHV